MPDSTTRIRPVAMTIAGSDSGGGAGIQADLKTFHQFGVYGVTALSAVTAQNTKGVTAIHVVPVDVLEAQILAVLSDLPPIAVKTGMLPTAEHVEVVSSLARRGRLPQLVVDPVMVATSGDRLLEAGAEQAVIGLARHAALVTPNRMEAEIMLGRTLDGDADVEAAARAFVEMGAAAALVKGGHVAGVEDRTLTDVLFDGESVHRFSHIRHDTEHTHGTGCTLSAAVAAGLSLGHPLVRATETAVRFVTDAVGQAPGLGSGRGPVDHFAPVTVSEGIPPGPEVTEPVRE